MTSSRRFSVRICSLPNGANGTRTALARMTRIASAGRAEVVQEVLRVRRVEGTENAFLAQARHGTSRAIGSRLSPSVSGRVPQVRLAQKLPDDDAEPISRVGNAFW